MLFQLAWRNVLRNPRRSLLTASAMAAAVLVCSTMMVFMNGMYGQMRDVLIGQQLGHVQLHHPAWSVSRDAHDVMPDADALLASLEAVPGVERATVRVFGSALLGTDVGTEGVWLTGVYPTREDAIREVARKVVEGVWLDEAPVRNIVLGADLARKLKAKVGTELVAVTQANDGSLGNELFRVSGIAKTGQPMIDRAGAFVHIQDLRDLLVLGDAAHEALVVGGSDEGAAVVALRNEVQAVLNGREASVRTWAEVDPGLSTLLGMQQVTSGVLLFFFFGVSAVGVVNTLLMSVFERTRELGVMRALGLRPREVVGMVMLEALSLGALAVAVGLVLTGLADLYLVTYGLNLAVNGEGWAMGDMTFDPVVKGRLSWDSILQPVAGVFICSAVAAIWPALRAAALLPVEAMREGGA